MNQTKSQIILIWSGKNTKKLSQTRYQKTKKVRTKYQQIIWCSVCWHFVPTPGILIFNCCDEKYLPHCWHLAAYPNCTYCGYPELQFISNGGKIMIEDHKQFSLTLLRPSMYLIYASLCSRR